MPFEKDNRKGMNMIVTRIIIVVGLCLFDLMGAKAQTEQTGLLPRVRTIGILVAMEKEMRMLEKHFPDSNIIIRQCGMGKVNAAVGCTEMIRSYHPDVVISMGCAGGNGEGIRIGDVIASKEIAYHDVYCGDKLTYGQMHGMPSRFVADSALLKRALQLDAKVVPGLIVTGDWFVDTKEKMRGIVSHFPDTKAVDMESAAIAHVCYLYDIPFISFRIVSDMPLEDEHASQYFNFWETASEETFHIAKQYVESLMNHYISD